MTALSQVASDKNVVLSAKRSRTDEVDIIEEKLPRKQRNDTKEKDGVQVVAIDDARSSASHPKYWYFALKAMAKKKQWEAYEQHCMKEGARNRAYRRKLAETRKYKDLEQMSLEYDTYKEHLETIDYNNLHLAYYPKSSPKFKY